MDPVFETYFRNRFQQEKSSDFYFASPSPGEAGAGQVARLIVRGAIDQTRQISPGPGSNGLRADAELLLYLAFTELVARPVLAVRGPTAQNGIAEAIGDDVALITNRAILSHEGGGLASAHDIVNVTANAWNNLRSADWQVWD
jgi:hypothetical protein